MLPRHPWLDTTSIHLSFYNFKQCTNIPLSASEPEFVFMSINSGATTLTTQA